MCKKTQWHSHILSLQKDEVFFRALSLVPQIPGERRRGHPCGRVFEDTTTGKSIADAEQPVTFLPNQHKGHKIMLDHKGSTSLHVVRHFGQIRPRLEAQQQVIRTCMNARWRNYGVYLSISISKDIESRSIGCVRNYAIVRWRRFK